VNEHYNSILQYFKDVFLTWLRTVFLNNR